MAVPRVPFGVTPGRTRVVVDDATLTVTFGTWRLSTPLENVAGTEVTGLYAFVKTAGPPHLSFTDRGMTCATNDVHGLKRVLDQARLQVVAGGGSSTAGAPSPPSRP